MFIWLKMGDLIAKIVKVGEGKSDIRLYDVFPHDCQYRNDLGQMTTINDRVP